MKRGITRIQDLFDRSERRPGDLCWHWLGAMVKGSPRIWTFDHDRGEKRCMPGPTAVWNIAHGAAPRGGIPYRSCGCTDCVCPAHIRIAENTTEMHAALAATGRLKGAHLEARRANIRRAWEVTGKTPTPEATVRQILARIGSETGRAIARDLGVSEQAVSRIKLRSRRAEVTPA